MSTTSTAAAQPSGAFPPPPGVTPNLANPADHLHTVNIVGLTVCNAFIVFFFAFRCVAKWHLDLLKTGEDWACQIAFVLSVLYVATCYMMARYGEGYHAWEITPDNYKQMLKWLYISSTVWIPAAFFVKATILLLMARVFEVYQRVAKCIRIYVWLLLITFLPVQGVKIFICTPIRHYWDPAVPGHCLNQPKVFLTDTAMAIATDFIILAIPVPLTWKLRVPMRRKLKIMAMLSAGGCAIAVACFREYKIYIFQWSKDVSGDFVVMNLCGTIELTIGMVCACLPPINLFIKKCFRPGLSRNISRSRNRTSRGFWHVSYGTKPGLGTPCQSTTADDTPSRSDGAVTNSQPIDAESGCLNKDQMSTDPTQRGTEDQKSLDELDLRDLLRHDSSDGRREGWLATDQPGTLASQLQDGQVAQKPMAHVTLEQLRQDGRDIIVPDRIWDGAQRNSRLGNYSNCTGQANN